MFIKYFIVFLLNITSLCINMRIFIEYYVNYANFMQIFVDKKGLLAYNYSIIGLNWTIIF